MTRNGSQRHKKNEDKWPLGPRRSSAASHTQTIRFRIQEGGGGHVSCECCVFLGTGLCVELITPPEEFYQM
jgi:hypothetical protein